MAYKQIVYQKAKAELEARRKKAERENDARRIKAITLCPEIARVEGEIASYGLDAVKALGMGGDAEKYIRDVPEIEKYVIMPDHIHMIIRLDNGSMWASTPTGTKGNRIASIVRSVKILTTKEIGTPIFQRSYYDHVIRNQADYDEIWTYIENNPKSWWLKHCSQE